MFFQSSFLSRWKHSILIFLHILVTAETHLQLKLVQLLVRHGDRSPLIKFPTDPWKNTWHDDFGQLTKLGIQQQFMVGKYLRQRYGALINERYDCKTVFVRSTDYDRTLMSASANLAGFLPPRGRQIWNENLAWQPIPVHTVPIGEDYILSSIAECPKYDELNRKVLASREAEMIADKYRDFFRFLSEKTGVYVYNFHKASEIYDLLFVKQTHKLPLPDWVNKEILDELKQLSILHLVWLAKTPGMRRLRSGPLVGEIIKNMQTSISDSTDQRKLYMFSAHDDTITGLLSTLDVLDAQLPPYCSMLMFELLKGDEMYFVKFLYRNDTTREPYELKLKDCSSPCPLARFVNLTAGVIPKDVKYECFNV